MPLDIGKIAGRLRAKEKPAAPAVPPASEPDGDEAADSSAAKGLALKAALASGDGADICEAVRAIAGEKY